MDLSNLKPAKGSTFSRRRLGRGQGSGYGGTSTRGHKGAKSRSGYSRKIGFEGGQMPLQRLVPKFGFNNINRVEYQVINLSELEDIAVKFNTNDINIEVLKQAGYISNNDKVAKQVKIKVLGGGSITRALNVTANAFSKSAIAAIEAQKGTINTL